MQSYIVLTFYKFVALPEYEAMKPELLDVMKANEVKGTIILASEGVNGTFCGTPEGVAAVVNKMHSYPGLENLAFKETWHDNNPFEKSKVKLRKEIVTLGVEGLDPVNEAGTYVEPEDWNNLISDPEVLVIDTRNDYEVELGTFKGAINPKTENFRDFPRYVEENLLDKKDKKIAMMCTGGIRCEKSTAYLKKLGFKEVYHLKDGILNYLKQIPAEQSLWEGTCFVFDDRVTLTHDLESIGEGAIDKEWKNKSRAKNAAAR
ncbi:rhodanese-related sulfurtransferase [Legionella dresdenensis]|uniref:tRNA uridine(34) hydroxylase n=1 Tax=Legionella dresdenensis TaxID=450200 RepID=A0ABV8CH60_9GAMM